MPNAECRIPNTSIAHARRQMQMLDNNRHQLKVKLGKCTKWKSENKCCLVLGLRVIKLASRTCMHSSRVCLSLCVGHASGHFKLRSPRRETNGPATPTVQLECGQGPVCVAGNMHVFPNPFPLFLLFLLVASRRFASPAAHAGRATDKQTNRLAKTSGKGQKLLPRVGSSRVESSWVEAHRVLLAMCDEIKKFETISS